MKRQPGDSVTVAGVRREASRDQRILVNDFGKSEYRNYNPYERYKRSVELFLASSYSSVTCGSDLNSIA